MCYSVLVEIFRPIFLYGRTDFVFDDFKNLTEEDYERVGLKKIFPLKPGHLVPLYLDRAFKNLANDKMTRAYFAKLISLVTDIDFDYLLENMFIADNNTQEGSLLEHHNEQDVIVTLDNMRINVEMSINNKDENIRKNLITWLKQTGNMYKIGQGYRLPKICIQICIENYDVFNNDLLINKVMYVEVSSGNYEHLTDDYAQYHINLKRLPKVCYNELTEMEKYYTLLTLDDEKELMELCRGDDILMDAIDKIKIMSNDSGFITELEHDQIDEYCRLLAQESKYDEGKKIGEKSKQIEIARKSLEQNIDVETISIITGLTIDEINKLKEETTL